MSIATATEKRRAKRHLDEARDAQDDAWARWLSTGAAHHEATLASNAADANALTAEATAADRRRWRNAAAGDHILAGLRHREAIDATAEARRAYEQAGA
jgi:hypothetical protein